MNIPRRNLKNQNMAATLLMCLLGYACVPGTTFADTDQIAFPGAEGAGRFALGGRGGRVIYVANLNDDGPGSLRAAIDAKGARTIVFGVSGTIELKSELRITNSRVTIAGQTAPGDGITLKNHQLTVMADDVIIRYIRCRPGDEAKVDTDALNVARGNRVIIDHVSASWSTDETLSGGSKYDRPENAVDNLTVQWSLIAESLNENVAKGPGHPHGFGSLIRGGRGSKFSWHHNLWASHEDRMPRPGNYTLTVPTERYPVPDLIGGLMDFRSNVFYNWGRKRSGYNNDVEGTVSTYNFVNNAYLSGPESDGNIAFQEGSSKARAYFAGNSMNGNVPDDPYSLVIVDPKSLPDGLLDGYKLSAPIDVAPVSDDPAPAAYEKVLRWAGASLVRDAVDLRIINDVKNRTGKIINSQTEVGGWPTLKSIPAPKDLDQDGMPDVWEIERGLNPNSAADGAQSSRTSGYTNLEDYLNGLVATAK